MNTKPPTNYGAWALGISFLCFFLRFWFAGRIDLAPDEAYYWEWSRHPALSYYDQGPMLSLAIRLGTWLVGNVERGVRLPALISGLWLSLLAYGLCARFWRQPRAGLACVLGLNAMLLYSVGGVLMVHDSLQVAFWATALACGLAAVRHDSLGAWLGFGFFGGLGLLSKYTGVFLFPCLGLALITHPQLRPKLKQAGPWLALAIGITAGLPIVFWNWQNHWPSFSHVFSLAGGDASRHSFRSLPEFLLSQVGLVTPVFFGLVLASWTGTWRRFRAAQVEAEEWVLWCCAVPLFLFFVLMSLRTRVEGNWPAPAYFSAFLLTVLGIFRQPRPETKWMKAGLALALAMTLLVHLQAVRPFLPLPGDKARLDSLSRVDGWKAMAADVDAGLAGLPEGAFVGAATYQNAAELSFYLKGQPACLIVVNGGINHQYRFWNDAASFRGKDAILVAGMEWEAQDFASRFEKLEKLGDVVLWRHGAEARRQTLYRGLRFKG